MPSCLLNGDKIQSPAVADNQLHCVYVPVKDIANVFNVKVPNPANNITILNLRPSTDEFVNVPAHILGSHKVTNVLSIACSNRQEVKKNKLIIDPDAFSLSGLLTKLLYITDCNLEFLDFAFLVPFSKLFEVDILFSSNIGKANWSTLPYLPALIKMVIYDDNPPDLNNHWSTNLPPLKRGLFCVELKGIGFSGDKVADRIFQWLLDTSAKTLDVIKIERWGNLTRIPSRHWSSFENLRYVMLSCDNFDIEVIEENSILFGDACLDKIIIKNCGIRMIQPGAIKGDILKLLYKLIK